MAYLAELDQVFRKMNRKFVTERDKILLDGQVSLQQALLLQEVIDKGPQQPGQLAEALGISSGGVTALCNKLVQRGYITRKRSSFDRRIIYIRATNKGEQLLKNYETLSIKDYVFNGLSEQEQLQQIQLCERIIQNLDNLVGPVQQRVNQIEQEKLPSHSV